MSLDMPTEELVADIRPLIEEVAALTGERSPDLLRPDAAVLSEEALQSGGDGFYLIGLIGGKNVGKSALVNALVGEPISERTAVGAGTDRVIAYAHVSQEAPVAELLNRETPGRHRIVTHHNAGLRRQVLLDLPDVDSHYADHVAITRRMLRHMLYPLWMQSVEKYADHRPAELLAEVCAGNSPENFLFCLNKADQLAARESPQAIAELAADYARRLAGQLALPSPPKVFAIAAIHPDQYDLPDLKARLMHDRPEATVRSDRRLAVRQLGRTSLDWLDRRRLPERIAALDRLRDTARDTLTRRVAAPLIEQVVPRLMDDPGLRASMVAELTRLRVSRWPIVSVLHTVLEPLLWAGRFRLSAGQQQAFAGSEALVAAHLHADRNPAGDLLRHAFASLHQGHPQVPGLYHDRRLWEHAPAEASIADLGRGLARTIDQLRETARARLGGIGAILAWPLRMATTIGAALWFPFGQPLLAGFLSSDAAASAPTLDAAGLEAWLALIVGLLSGSWLVHNAATLGVYFLVLWLLLRWDTGRRVDRALAAWRRGDQLDPELSPTGWVLEWLEGLLDPIDLARERLAAASERIEALRRHLQTGRAA